MLRGKAVRLVQGCEWHRRIIFGEAPYDTSFPQTTPCGFPDTYLGPQPPQWYLHSTYVLQARPLPLSNHPGHGYCLASGRCAVQPMRSKVSNRTRRAWFNRSRASMTFKRHYFEMSPTIIDYRGHSRTLLFVREIDLKACALVILSHIIRSDLDSNPVPKVTRSCIPAAQRVKPQEQACI